MQHLAWLYEFWMLLPDGPESSGSKKHHGAYPVKNSLEDSLPLGRGGACRSSHRHIGKRISGPCLPLFHFEVGHVSLGCTSYAKPGMEIALPAVPASHYTDPE
jgi:hypothetical protein